MTMVVVTVSCMSSVRVIVRRALDVCRRVVAVRMGIVVGGLRTPGAKLMQGKIRGGIHEIR